MALITSSEFASVIETGTDWRDTSKKVLEALEGARTEGRVFNFGFLYVSDHLAEDFTSIVNLFKSVLNIDTWTGCVGLGVCGNGREHIDKPAISAMIGYFPPEQFMVFPPVHTDDDEGRGAIAAWLEEQDPMLVLAHGNPAGEEDPARTLQVLDETIGGFIVGGLSSSRFIYGQVAGDVYHDGLSGAAFSMQVPVASALSQGCKPVGTVHTITRGHDHTIAELDGERAVGIFERDMRDMVIGEIGQDPNDIVIDEEVLENPSAVPDEFKGLFKGEMHAAFLVPGSDQRDYLVRNVIGLDDERGSMDVAQLVTPGEQVIFVYRDDDTVREDLSRTLVELRKRIERDHGVFAPKGGIYVSCLARAFCDFSQNGGVQDGQCGEMALVREIIGDVPLAGFYAGGEISKARLYGYTGILTLFL